jgi:hypothetical protein
MVTLLKTRETLKILAGNVGNTGNSTFYFFGWEIFFFANFITLKRLFQIKNEILVLPPLPVLPNP